MSQEDADKESHLRSIIKAGTYRAVGTGSTLLISYLVTGKSSVAFTIAGVEVVSKMVIYYLHERAWQAVARGTIRRLFKLQAAQQHASAPVNKRANICI